MKRVSLSLRAAAWLFDEVTNYRRSFNLDGTGLPRELEELMRAINHPQINKSWAAYRKSIGAGPTRKAARVAKKKTKAVETKDIRAAVMARAENRCELCGIGGDNFSPLELHHALGRGRAKQAVENCLACCRRCHRDITDNRPSSVDVLQAQASKFGQLGCHETARLLLRRRDFILARGAA